MIRVGTFLWRDEGYRFNHLFRYGAEHVNRWASSVRRELSMPHELFCVTDDATGIDPSVRIVPLWDELRHLGGCYVRLRAFSEEMRDIIGPRFVWMDLDCVITGALDPLFSREEDFVIWANGYGPTPYCGSMVMMTAGARKQVWEDFDPATSPLAGKDQGYIGTDQRWIAARLGPDEAVWTRRDGVLSRLDCISHSRLPGRAKRLSRQTLPAGTRVVFFHGPVSPCQPELQKACPWIAEHWR